MATVIAEMSMSLDSFVADPSDEVHIDIVAVLLGEGIRYFDHLSNTPLALEGPTVIEVPASPISSTAFGNRTAHRDGD